MLQFISGVFKGWKHETFGQCFLDYAWLIQEELPQSKIWDDVGGGPEAPARKAGIDDDWDWPSPRERKSRDDKDVGEMLQMMLAVGVFEERSSTCLRRRF